MKDDMAFVGDVHGNYDAMVGLLNRLRSRVLSRIVFLGDYVNKGPESARVLDHLIDQAEVEPLVLLRGNHEDALLRAIDTGDLRPLLKLGGAPTIRSYVGGDVGPDVADDLRAAVPAKHLAALRRMPEVFESDGVVASHKALRVEDPRYRVSAHVRVGSIPTVGVDGASIDTGCGSGGRLTAFFWPSRTFLQVDDRGRPVWQSVTDATCRPGHVVQ